MLFLLLSLLLLWLLFFQKKKKGGGLQKKEKRKWNEMKCQNKQISRSHNLIFRKYHGVCIYIYINIPLGMVWTFIGDIGWDNNGLDYDGKKENFQIKQFFFFFF